ncbi:hypothetical protein [Pyxidicoccus sp. MSG2]|uniref:hypothetical protein n=1 Tax=Pyxidicoccus sp. MSG2 TaxID=2996790 RepID=UPI00226F1AEB|nr:hypothetical protein [Pyxidicoccus sp. MSG2]MCY1023099.1 hypothetical protein [Pyxidicoccus sp. MSG2]
MSPPNPISIRHPYVVAPNSWPRLLTVCVLALMACGPSEDVPEVEATQTLRQAVDRTSIDPARQLFVTDASVVDDARFTKWDPRKVNSAPDGGWSFGRLIDNMLPDALYGLRGRDKDWARSMFVLHWLRTWEHEQLINGQRVPARPAIRSLVIDPWRAASGCIGADFQCVLDFGKAPFRLLAIVYRPDLRRLPSVGEPGRAGEGRFVFGVLGPNGERKPFTVIFEYALPIIGKPDILIWAKRFHALGQEPFGPKYNEKLFEATRRFTRRDAARRRQNGSALLQVRTNEVPLSPASPQEWEMREFVLGPSGLLTPDTVKQEVDAALNGTQTLGDWAARNASAILAGTHDVPARWRGAPFRAGAAPVPQNSLWQVPGVTEEVRHAFAQATCSGCHKAETGTNFLHVRTREVGAASSVSAFLAQELALDGPRVTDFAELLNTQDLARVKEGRRQEHSQE